MQGEMALCAPSQGLGLHQTLRALFGLGWVSDRAASPLEISFPLEPQGFKSRGAGSSGGGQGPLPGVGEKLTTHEVWGIWKGGAGGGMVLGYRWGCTLASLEVNPGGQGSRRVPIPF